MYYAYDIYGDGYATVSENLPEEYENFIGEYESEDEASKEAAKYEDFIQNEIDKASERWFYEPDEDDE